MAVALKRGKWGLHDSTRQQELQQTVPVACALLITQHMQRASLACSPAECVIPPALHQAAQHERQRAPQVLRQSAQLMIRSWNSSNKARLVAEQSLEGGDAPGATRVARHARAAVPPTRRRPNAAAPHVSQDPESATGVATLDATACLKPARAALGNASLLPLPSP